MPSNYAFQTDPGDGVSLFCWAVVPGPLNAALGDRFRCRLAAAFTGVPRGASRSEVRESPFMAEFSTLPFQRFKFISVLLVVKVRDSLHLGAQFSVKLMPSFPDFCLAAVCGHTVT